MTQLVASSRVVPGPLTDVMAGRILWDGPQSVWVLGHLGIAVVGGVLTVSWSAVLVFVVLTALTICAGHSVGMHRLLIHRSFKTPKLLEYVLVWLGVLVGMAGPIGMIRAHDMRDWHQRQTLCPAHPSHGAGFWQDAWWQMHCRYALDHPPEFIVEPEVARDPVYLFVERWWRWQQLPVALLLYAGGGIGWVVWGISVRISVSLIGHWLVGHYAHKGGHQGWRVSGLAVQGYNLRGLGLVTFGENWHGNHHAFPGSARLGVEPGQMDPGYWFIKALEQVGLAQDVQTPETLVPRPGLTSV